MPVHTLVWDKNKKGKRSTCIQLPWSKKVEDKEDKKIMKINKDKHPHTILFPLLIKDKVAMLRLVKIFSCYFFNLFLSD